MPLLKGVKKNLETSFNYTFLTMHIFANVKILFVSY